MERLTQKRLKELLDYDPVTGVFRWKVAVGRHGRIAAGSIAGNVSKISGYRLIGIGGAGRTLRAGRLAWLYVTGEWPPATVDHWDLDKSNDRFVNLRLASNLQNKRNSPIYRSNKSGVAGVRFEADRNCWRAQINRNGRSVVLGRFATKAEAVRVRAEAVRKEYGAFAATHGIAIPGFPPTWLCHVIRNCSSVDRKAA